MEVYTRRICGWVHYETHESDRDLRRVLVAEQDLCRLLPKVCGRRPALEVGAELERTQSLRFHLHLRLHWSLNFRLGSVRVARREETNLCSLHWALNFRLGSVRVVRREVISLLRRGSRLGPVRRHPQ